MHATFWWIDGQVARQQSHIANKSILRNDYGVVYIGI